MFAAGSSAINVAAGSRALLLSGLRTMQIRFAQTKRTSKLSRAKRRKQYVEDRRKWA